MAAEEKTTWTEVCSKVGFSDGLYKTCREKVEGYTGLDGAIYDEEPVEDDGPDFTRMLMKQARPVPPPPPEDWEPEPEGFFDELMHGTTGKYVLAGGAAALAAWWFWIRTQSTTPKAA